LREKANSSQTKTAETKLESILISLQFESVANGKAHLGGGQYLFGDCRRGKKKKLCQPRSCQNDQRAVGRNPQNISSKKET